MLQSGVETFGSFSTSNGHIGLDKFRAGVNAMKEGLLRDTEFHLHVDVLLPESGTTNQEIENYCNIGILPSDERAHSASLCA